MADEWKAKGNAALKKKEFDEAIKCYTEAIKINGSNQVYYSNRSAAHLSKNDIANALKDAEQCIKIKPDWGKGYLRKAQALRKMGDSRGEMDAYQAGIDKCPTDKALRNAAMKVQNKQFIQIGKMMFQPGYLEKLKANPETRAFLDDATFVQMLEMCRQRPEFLGQLLQTDQRMTKVFQVLSGMNVQMSGGGGAGGAPAPAPAPSRPRQTRSHWAPKPKEKSAEELAAEEAAKKEVEEEVIDPEEEARKQKEEAIKAKALAFKEEGNALYKEKKWDEAIAKYTLAMDTEPKNMTFLLNIASAHFGSKDYEACIASCKKALDVAMEHGGSFELKAKAHGRIGNAYFKQKDYTKAIDAYERGLLENQDKNIAKKLLKTKRAKAKADALAYLCPEKAAEAKQKGNDRFHAGDFVGSLTFYSEAIKRDPTNSVYYMNRAYAYTKLMDFDRGLQDVTKGLKIDPTNVKGFYRKGSIEIMLKKYSRALDSFRAGLKISPSDKACNQGVKQVMDRINAEADAGTNQERAKEAMKDPEIAQIVNDPVMRSILEELNDPKKMQHHMQNAGVRAKIEKLVAAGVIGGRMS